MVPAFGMEFGEGDGEAGISEEKRLFTGSRSDQGSAIPPLPGEKAPQTLVLLYFGAWETDFLPLLVLVRRVAAP